MSLFITSLNSGSNGNCYYIGNKQEAILVDAGISCRETETRMQRLRLSMEKVKAIFISHEHSDHIQGLRVIAKKYGLPVFITDATLQGCGGLEEDTSVTSFQALQPVSIGTLNVTAFPKLHDAAEPHSFVINDNEVTVGVFTDIGFPCNHVIHHFKKCDAAFLETNYDEMMLEKGSYPFHLKKRISGKHGHLSNQQALELFTRHKSPNMSHLFLSHLSKENNQPELVEKLFTSHAGNTKIIVASRFKETGLYEIRHTPASVPKKKSGKTPPAPTNQLSLF